MIHLFKIIIFIINILLCRNLSLITANPRRNSAYILEHICMLYLFIRISVNIVGDIETHVIKYIFNDIINHSFVLNLCSHTTQSVD